MFFTKKAPSTLTKSSTTKNKSQFHALELLLAELGIKFHKNKTAVPQQKKQPQKVRPYAASGHTQEELEKIAENQILYAKLLQAKMKGIA